MFYKAMIFSILALNAPTNTKDLMVFCNSGIVHFCTDDTVLLIFIIDFISVKLVLYRELLYSVI